MTTISACWLLGTLTYRQALWTGLVWCCVRSSVVERPRDLDEMRSIGWSSSMEPKFLQFFHTRKPVKVNVTTLIWVPVRHMLDHFLPYVSLCDQRKSLNNSGGSNHSAAQVGLFINVLKLRSQSNHLIIWFLTSRILTYDSSNFQLHTWIICSTLIISSQWIENMHQDGVP